MILVDNRNVTDPYINLAIEEYLIRHSDGKGKDYLFLYINEPCIVLGKNQSIYREINFDFLRNNQLKLCRRISGGGTVYQDKGNLNFAFITSFANEKVNNYKIFNQLIIDALMQSGVEATIDARNNILYQGKKISGNAQFTDRKNLISHGTLLFNANLNLLRSSLKQNVFQVESKAPQSVPSSVANIHPFANEISTTEELKKFISTYAKPENVFQFSEMEWNEIEQLAKEKFESYEWVYGRSPKTKITKSEIMITVEDGIIAELHFAYNRDIQLTKELIGVKYCAIEIKKALNERANREQLFEMIF